jgi:hypothetical protein
MFSQQLLKLVERLIEMTQEELVLLKQMKIKEAGIITTEKEPLVTLYQNCIQKIKVDKAMATLVKQWEKFELLKERIAFLGELSVEHELYIKRFEKAQSRFVRMMQETVLDTVQPVQNYNNRGSMVNRQKYYAKQGGGSLSALDQAL